MCGMTYFASSGEDGLAVGDAPLPVARVDRWVSSQVFRLLPQKAALTEARTAATEAEGRVERGRGG